MLVSTPPTRLTSLPRSLDAFPSEATISQRAQLTSDELALIAPTACGALNFVGAEFFGSNKELRDKSIKKEGAVAVSGRYCLNPEVLTAQLRVLNAAVDRSHPKQLVQETLATIFKNAFDFDYLNELMQLIQDECGAFNGAIDRLCADLDLKQNLRLKGVAFSCVNGKVGMKVMLRNVDPAFSKLTAEVLNTFFVTPAISSSIICQFQEWDSFETALSTADETIQNHLKNPLYQKILPLLKSAYEEEFIGVDFFKNLTFNHLRLLHYILIANYAEHRELVSKSKEVLLTLSEVVVDMVSNVSGLRKLMEQKKITVSDLVEIDAIIRNTPLEPSQIYKTCNLSDENSIRTWIAKHRAILLERSSFKSALSRAPACAETLTDYPTVSALLKSGYDAGVIGADYLLNLPVATIFAFKTILSSQQPGIKTLLAQYGTTVLLKFGRAVLVALAHERKMHPLIERGEISLDILKLIDAIAKTKRLDSRTLSAECDLADINAIKAWIEANR